MLTLDRVRSLLVGLVADPVLRPDEVGEFQQLVWNESEPISGASEEQDEILRSLAYDLDFFEPDDRARAEDPSFFGEERARSEIVEALRAIEPAREA